MKNGAVMILTFLLVAGCTADGSRDGVTELVYATPYSPTHPFSRADQRWIDYVESRSGGTLRIRPSWSGALVSSEHSLVELRHGVADISLITPIYVKGGVHLIRAQSGFYRGVRSIEQQVALYYCLAGSNEQFEREMTGLKVLAVQGGSLPGLMTRERPVSSLDELRGMRIRVPSELINVMRELGADPVNMPMGEVYSALAKGILDGVIAPTDTLRALYFAEVTNFYTPLAVPRGAYPARAMGRDRWQRLTPGQRAVLEASIPVWEAALAEENRRALDEGWQFGLEQGIEEIPLTVGDQERFDALYAAEAAINAAALARYGIDGEAVLAQARASVMPDGRIACAEVSE